MLKNIKLYFLLGIVVASTAISLVSPAQVATAQTEDETSTIDLKGFDAEAVQDALGANLYRQILAQCLLKNDKDKEFKGGNLVKGDWVDLSGNNDADYKAYVTNFALPQSGDGVFSCGEGKTIVTGLLNKFGKSTDTGSSLVYACELFVVPKTVNDDDQEDVSREDARCPQNKATDSSDYLQKGSTLQYSNGGGAGGAFNSLTSVIDGWGYTFQEDDLGFGLGSVQNYLLYKHTIFEQCSAKAEIPLGEGVASSSVGTITLQIVDKQGNINPIRYTIDNDKEVAAAIGNISYFVGPKCSEAAATMDGLAGAYSDWLKAHTDAAGATTETTPPGGGASISTCRMSS
jgi:hypothetical protein